MKVERIEKFSGVAGQDFSAWFKKFMIHLKREEFTLEEGKIDELFVCLEGTPMNWFIENQEMNSLPDTL